MPITLSDKEIDCLIVELDYFYYEEGISSEAKAILDKLSEQREARRR